MQPIHGQTTANVNRGERLRLFILTALGAICALTKRCRLFSAGFGPALGWKEKLQEPLRSKDRVLGGPGGGKYAWYVVVVLMFTYTVAFIDRQILSLLVQPIRRDLDLSDTQISLLAGFAFAVFYSVLGVPIARLADRVNRRYLIAAGVALWSLMTAACGLSKTYWQLFAMRVGVGVGEATLSPAAYSMIADYFPPHKLARAISVYTMGLYGGAGLALLAGSAVVALVSDAGPIAVPLIGDVRAWQVTFFIVALPGVLVLALLATVREPIRREISGYAADAAEPRGRDAVREIWDFFRRHRRIMLAHFGGFMALGTVITAYLVWVPEFLRRTHGFEIAEAGLIYGLALLVFGTAGPYVGGWLAERLALAGRHDAELRAAMIAGVGMIPLSVLTPLVADPTLAVVLLALATFVLAMPQGLAPTVIQLIAPNRIRGQITAIFILIAVLAGYTGGPTSVAMLNDYLFRDDGALNYSLAIVSGVLTPVGVLMLLWGLKPYREVRRAVLEQGGGDG